ncbi:MmgE/PrpD family protein [Natrononativus amylolyticus]|uniref:MmgE/PrpD family protein n=1 Tax=Natrononativus amylolyticus TaxID=2963434 RepID=UPI0020CCD2D5|nr:MmgE/PrpD family protein [Natrononativus amylolyticus]
MVEPLAAYCADAPAPDRETAERIERHLLDWIGLVAGGRAHARSAASVLEAVEALGGADAPRVPTGGALAADRAALLGGTFAHSLDFDDTHRESSLHPGAPVIAAALPVARERGTTGEELFAAISLGYDVTCALGRAVDPDAHYARGFHLTATCGTFGATAAVGRLRGFDATAFEAAFGVNGSQAAGSLQFLENGAWNKRLHPGLAAQRAVLAAELVDAGFRGAAEPIEGAYGFLHGYTETAHPEVLASIEPGAAVLETALKPYPCCRYMHAAIDAMLDLRGEVDLEAVESVTVDLPAPGVRLTGEPIEAKRRPSNFVDCQFSAPFAAALALARGEAGLAAFLEAQENLDEPALCELMDRVEVVSTDETNDEFPQRWTARVSVDADGRHERFVEYARGEPEKPMSWAEVREKFRELAGTSGVDGEAADAIVEAVDGLGSGDSTAPLFDALDRAE